MPRLAALLLVASLLPACSSEPPPPPNVIIWMVDTLRADHLGCYGYERPTSPVIDALAAAGVVFEETHAHSNWTQPSIASLMSGRYPPVFSGDFTSRCPDDYMMAAEWFSENGYATAGFTMTIASGAKYGFDQGFDTYDELAKLLPLKEQSVRAGPAFDAHHLVDAAARWIDRRGPNDPPFFLYLHSVDPHAPYEPHDETVAFTGDYDGSIDGAVDTLHDALRGDYPFTDADIQNVIDLYDGEIVYNDAQLGKLVEALEASGVHDDTLLVVISDHGEELWDHDTHGHGHRNVHRELTRIPFVLHWPAGLPAGTRVDGLVRGIDVLPTLVDLAGLPPVEGASGRSVSAAIDSSVDVPQTYVLVDRAKELVDVAGARSTEMLYVSDPRGQRTGLFNWIEDPAERIDVRAEVPTVADELEKLVDAWRHDRESIERSVSVEMDAETRMALEALGYLEAEVEDR